MKNIDIARRTFDPAKNFSSVLKQQGRVELEADWNEQAEIMLHVLRTMMRDLVGPHGGPIENCGFNVLVPSLKFLQDYGDDARTLVLLNKCERGDFVVTRGRYYVDGILVENPAPLLYTAQRRHYPGVLGSSASHLHLVYLDVWEREVTALEDPDIREIALGGADTAARRQVVWRIRSAEIARTAIVVATGGPTLDELVLLLWTRHVEAFDALPRGRLKARTQPSIDDEGVVIADSEAGSYLGLENQLYRVEIHRGGNPYKDGGPTFKWSRDNGTVVFAVQTVSIQDESSLSVHLGSVARDDSTMLDVGDWVEFDDAANPGHRLSHALLRVVAVDAASRTVKLERPVPLPSVDTANDVLTSSREHPLILRRWDHGTTHDLDLVDGAISLEEGSWLPIEDGIEIWFEPEPAHDYRAGDYWLIPARVVTADVEWPVDDSGQPEPREPVGPRHHYAPLAIVDVTAKRTHVEIDLTRSFGHEPDPQQPGRSFLVRNGT